MQMTPSRVQLKKKGSNVYKTFHFIKNEFYFQYLNLKRFLILNLNEFWAPLKNYSLEGVICILSPLLNCVKNEFYFHNLAPNKGSIYQISLNLINFQNLAPPEGSFEFCAPLWGYYERVKRSTKC